MDEATELAMREQKWMDEEKEKSGGEGGRG